MATFNVYTKFRTCISITGEVEETVSAAAVSEGLCVITAPSPTMGLCITSFWDKRGLDDLLDEIDRNFPTRVTYKNQYAPYDSSGQVKSAVMGNRLVIPIIGGKPLLGSSQGVVLIDFDGPRHRNYHVAVVEAPVYSRKISVKTVYMGVHSLLSEVNAAIKDSGLSTGICHLSCLHSTAGLGRTGISDAAKADHMARIEAMVPTRVDFKHRETASDAGGHIKTAVFQNQLDVLFENGELLLPEGEDLCFFEYDGPRPRNVVISLVAEGN